MKAIGSRPVYFEDCDIRMHRRYIHIVSWKMLPHRQRSIKNQRRLTTSSEECHCLWPFFDGRPHAACYLRPFFDGRPHAACSFFFCASDVSYADETPLGFRAMFRIPRTILLPLGSAYGTVCRVEEEEEEEEANTASQLT